MPDLEHPDITRANRTGYANSVEQSKHWGTDYYDTEIFAGDEVVKDPNNGEVILKENLERYLSEVYELKFKIAD